MVFFSFVDIFPYQDIKIVSWDRDIYAGSILVFIIGKILKMPLKIPTCPPSICIILSGQDLW